MDKGQTNNWKGPCRGTDISFYIPQIATWSAISISKSTTFYVDPWSRLITYSAWSEVRNPQSGYNTKPALRAGFVGVPRTGIEPVIPPWKGGVLTPWPTRHFRLLWDCKGNAKKLFEQIISAWFFIFFSKLRFCPHPCSSIRYTYILNGAMDCPTTKTVYDHHK